MVVPMALMILALALLVWLTVDQHLAKKHVSR
jgi:hypothetical protein